MYPEAGKKVEGFLYALLVLSWYIVIRESPNFQALMVPMEVYQGQASTKQRWHSQIFITMMSSSIICQRIVMTRTITGGRGTAALSQTGSISA